jgi:hypothetical protein
LAGTLQYHPVRKPFGLELDPYVFQHPGLQILNIWQEFQCRISLSPSSFSNSSAHTTNLTTLLLHKCEIDPTTLNKILSIPRALRHLELTGLLWRAYDRCPPVETAAYVEAVSQHRNSLEHLSLLYHDKPPHRIVGANLETFKALKNLDIQCTTLFPCSCDREIFRLHGQPEINELLPKSLENLTLRYDLDPFGDPLDIFKRLAGEKEAQFPLLRRITLKEDTHISWQLDIQEWGSKIANCVPVLSTVGVELRHLSSRLYYSAGR